MNWNHLQTAYPLAIALLQKWYAIQIQELVPNAVCQIDAELGIYIGDGRAFLTNKDLYAFFDERNMQLYIIPTTLWPNCTYFIQLPNGRKETQQTFAERGDAEAAGFQLCFKILNLYLANKSAIKTK